MSGRGKGAGKGLGRRKGKGQGKGQGKVTNTKGQPMVVDEMDEVEEVAVDGVVETMMSIPPSEVSEVEADKENQDPVKKVKKSKKTGPICSLGLLANWQATTMDGQTHLFHSVRDMVVGLRALGHPIPSVESCRSRIRRSRKGTSGKMKRSALIPYEGIKSIGKINEEHNVLANRPVALPAAVPADVATATSVPETVSMEDESEVDE